MPERARTGAERYLADQLKDPKYRAAYNEARAAIDGSRPPLRPDLHEALMAAGWGHKAILNLQDHYVPDQAAFETSFDDQSGYPYIVVTKQDTVIHFGPDETYDDIARMYPQDARFGKRVPVAAIMGSLAAFEPHGTHESTDPDELAEVCQRRAKPDVGSIRPARTAMNSPDGTTTEVVRVPLRETFEVIDDSYSAMQADQSNATRGGD